MSIGTGSIIQSSVAPKTAELQILGLTKIYTRPKKSYAFFEFESPQKAIENFCCIFSVSAAGDYQTYFSESKESKRFTRLERLSAFDLYKSDEAPKDAKYGFGLIPKTAVGGSIGQPIKTAEDLIKCVGQAIKTASVMKSIPLVSISEDEIISGHVGFDTKQQINLKPTDERKT
jgi:hypothetical protein